MWVQVRENPPSGLKRPGFGAVLQGCQQRPKSLHLAALIQCGFCPPGCMMVAAPADILPIFQGKKKGRKEGQMHESSFEKLSQKPHPVTAARDGSHSHT